MNLLDSPLDDDLGYTLARTHRRLKLGLKRAFKARGLSLTPEQWGILNILWEGDGLRQVDLAARVGKDAPNLTRIIDLMIKQGLVTRRPDPGDRRSFRIVLTPAGRGCQEELEGVVNGYLDRALAGLEPRELNRLMRTLKLINRNLDDLGID